jgi:PAS domain S-box-containing protein
MPEEIRMHKRWPQDISASVILHSLPNAVFLTDPQMRILYFNLEAERITGFKAYEACGMYCKDVLKSGICETECIVKRALDADQNIFNTETTIRIATGNTIPVLVSASLVKNTAGKVVGYLYSFRDISSLKKVEFALRKSEEKLDAILHSIGDHMSMMDGDLNIVWANNIAKNIFGDDIVGKKCYTAYHNRENSCEPYPCLALRAFQDGKVHEHNTEVIDKNGQIVHFHCTANVALRDEDGKAATVIEVSRDITEQKKLEQQLIQAQKMEAVGQLAGGIAHDFNNILTVIVGFANLLQMEISKDDSLQNKISPILSAAKRASELTHALLAFSRKQIMNPKPVNINQIIMGIEKFLSRIIGEDIELSVMLTDKDLITMADVNQLEQVLMNLSVNARDAMAEGGKLTVSTGFMKIDEQYIAEHGYGSEGLYAVISVEDTGHGIDRDTKERIFEPFFTTKEVGKGTGLGLAMVYGIIKQHSGYINVYSEADKGTTFKIYLPLIESEFENEKAHEIGLMRKGDETIFVAEDDMQVRNFIKTLLEKHGYKVITAIDGEDAIKVFHKNKENIQLVILDTIMPKKNGQEVFVEIMKISPYMKTIFMSGYTSDIVLKHGKLKSGINFIPKPISPYEFLTKIYELLHNN